MDATSLDALPDEILINIFMNADLTTLKSLCDSSTRFNRLCYDEDLWRQKYFSKFGPTSILPHQSWKTEFKRLIVPASRRSDVYLVELKKFGSSYYQPGQTVVFNVSDVDAIWDALVEIYRKFDRQNILYGNLDSTLRHYVQPTNVNRDIIKNVYLSRLPGFRAERFQRDPKAIVHTDLIKVSQVPYFE